MTLCDSSLIPLTQLVIWEAEYHLKTDPNLLTAKHTRKRVPIEYGEQIEKKLDEMVLQGTVPPKKAPTPCDSSL